MRFGASPPLGEPKKDSVFPSEVRHTETISYAQVMEDEKYRLGLVSNINNRTAKFSELGENKVTYLNILHHLGAYYSHSSFYPDKITELWKTGQLEALTPKIKIADSDLESLVRFYAEGRFTKKKVLPDRKKSLDKWQKECPLLSLNDRLLTFGPLFQRADGMNYSVGVTELGWAHMPSEYARLNIYSGLSENGDIEEEKMNSFTKIVGHLYKESLEKSNPLFGKLTRADNAEMRLCSYVNDDLLLWQLESLSRYFKEPLSIQTIVREGGNAEVKLFSGGKVGVRSSNEAGSGLVETKRLHDLIQKIIENQKTSRYLVH